jgi:hypothetical protein
VKTAVSVDCISPGRKNKFKCNQWRKLLLSLPSFVPDTLKHTYRVHRLIVIIFPLLFSLCVLSLPAANAAKINLRWDPSCGDVKGYKVYYGTSSKDYDFSVDVGNFTSCTISSLTEGKTYYFSVAGYGSGNVESDLSNEISYTISAGNELVEPRITSPLPGSTLNGSSVDFKWTGGYDPYWIYIGTSAKSKNIYDSGDLNSATSLDVNNLPTDGRKIYVTLWYMEDGEWQSEVHTYTADSSSFSTPKITSPLPGSTLNGSSVDFKWTGGYAPYWIYIGTSAKSKNIYDSGNLNSATSLDVNNLPTDGRKIYVTLWYMEDGEWQSEVFTYTSM